MDRYSTDTERCLTVNLLYSVCPSLTTMRMLNYVIKQSHCLAGTLCIVSKM